MDFLKGVLQSFIPREENDYKPYFFRARTMLALGAVILFLGISGLALQTVILKNNSFLAAVISSVLVNLANGDRTQNGLNGLAINPVLVQAAQLKANDMAAKSYFAHTSPGGVTPWHWFKEAGYQFSYAGENLAVRFSDSIDVNTAWMNSPTHRANILNAQFTEIGIATAQGVYQGQNVIFVVQEFGRPSSGRVALPVQGKTATTTLAAVATSTQPVLVAGTSTEEVAPKVIMESDSFIAVRAVSSTSTLVAAPTRSFKAFFEKFATSPRTLVNDLYLFIAALIGIAIAFMIGIELKRQHPLNVLYGILLLVLMGGLMYVGQMYFPGPLTIL